jgi:hypothetical protein
MYIRVRDVYRLLGELLHTDSDVERVADMLCPRHIAIPPEVRSPMHARAISGILWRLPAQNRFTRDERRLRKHRRVERRCIDTNVPCRG